MRRIRKSYAVRPQEDRRHAVSKINKEVSMKIAIEDSKGCNIPVKREADREEKLMRQKAFDSILSNRAVRVESPPYMDRQGPCTELAVGGMKKKWWQGLRTANFIQAVLATDEI